jgi:hypothetical protein
LEAFEVSETFPVKFPTDCGAKVTVNDALCPGDKFMGVVNPERVKPVPEIAACEMVALEPPVFCTVSVCV